ncbi:membrane protein DedA with SNARE-associated domain [Actinoalloteichus hoggarensis]|uniref:Uncharacterized protein n=1 Tax=Actinoalloteichus hoggarensis TaxID=1470176 RepID=A0A221VY58_9PSEU|nr:hypothetical protein [Actinoalloteichus hoggarensis]ASO18443.1 hypothetical protein AHOG_03935 [Actinoalloteichus hoggarensis]MBB5921810.1 membrane protein DedA with SNARE-associated domain [Actinoalloteichus hoggarensis]
MTQAASSPRSQAGTVTSARVCTIISFVLAAVATLFFPIVFGPAAIILAVVGYAMGDRSLAKWAIPAAIAATILGFVLGAMVFAAA